MDYFVGVREIVDILLYLTAILSNPNGTFFSNKSKTFQWVFAQNAPAKSIFWTKCLRGESNSLSRKMLEK